MHPQMRFVKRYICHINKQASIKRSQEVFNWEYKQDSPVKGHQHFYQGNIQYQFNVNCICNMAKPCKSTQLTRWRNSPVTNEFPSQRPAMRSFGVLFDLRLNKQWVNNSEVGECSESIACWWIPSTKWPVMKSFDAYLTVSFDKPVKDQSRYQ